MQLYLSVSKTIILFVSLCNRMENKNERKEESQKMVEL